MPVSVGSLSEYCSSFFLLCALSPTNCNVYGRGSEWVLGEFFLQNKWEIP